MCGFLGDVNHYHCMWSQHAHILASLSSKSGKTICWTYDMGLMFTPIKALIAQGCLLVYPNYNKSHHIYTDASGNQKGA